MPPSETSGGRRGSVLDGLLAPLRLPERVNEALEALAEAARDLGPMRSELTRVREQTEPLSDLMPALELVLVQTEPVPEVLPVVKQISKQSEPLAELLPVLEDFGGRIDGLREVVAAMEGAESHLNKTAKQLVDEVGAMHKTVSGLQEEVKTLTDRMPDPSRGPLDKARDALTGGS